ncbi:MAG: hypothetical protein KIC73_06120 [Clostridiales bacterium]|nr:hypothetical protein [Clostridiales bacterium]
MLGDLSGVAKIFLMAGYIDMWCSTDCLMAIVRDSVKEEWSKIPENLTVLTKKQ